MLPNRRPRALLLLVLTATLWSSGGVLIKLVECNPVCIAGARSLIAAAFIAIVARPTSFSLAALFRPQARFQFGAAVAYSLTVLLFVIANKLTTSANAILLQYTAPVWVALLGSRLLQERVTRFDWLTILAALLGMTLFFVERLTTENLLGNAVAIGSGVAFALFAICMRKHAQTYGTDTPSTDAVFWGNVLTAGIGLPFITQSFASGVVLPAEAWLGLALLGVFQLGLAYVLFVRAVPHVSALEAMLISMLEAVLNPVWVVLFLNEVPGVWTLVGGGIVLAALLVRGVVVSRLRV
jgi:drug/metabolite transporter (DMT)-like permease